MLVRHRTDTMPGPPRHPHPPLVLVADDEGAVRELVGRLLEAQGYRVLHAGSGEEAWALAQLAAETDPVDLVITDVVMPGVDGFALAAKLRTLPTAPAILLISGYAGGSGETGLPFLAKPFTVEDLVASVHRLVGS
jgi:two-component system cell cycle sensor histidine kinase/response regulator CckA